MKITLPNEFERRPYQRRYMAALDAGCKRAVAVWHRRAGKDVTDLHEACKLAHDPALKGVFWHVLPTEAQGRKAIWNGVSKDGRRIMEWVFPRSIRKFPREWTPNGTMIVELKCGSMFQLVGSDNIDSLVGAGPRRVAFSEYALSRPAAWDLVRPMLEENGGSATFLSSPRGRNSFHKLYEVAQANPEEWFTELVDVYHSGAFADPKEVLAKARREGMPEALVRQEWLCDFAAANVGSVWGDLVESLEQRGGLQPFEHDRDRVFASFDLGFRDSTACFLWRVEDDRVDFIDHTEAHGKPLSFYFDWLEERARSQGYRYDTFWLPHDARAHTLVTGSSVQEQFMERYPGKVEIGPALSLLDGIQAARKMLQGNVRIHPRCGEGLEALRQYSYAFDEDRSTFSTRPEHSVWSHSADAFRYAACVMVRTMDWARRAPPEELPNGVPPGHVFLADDGRLHLNATFKELADRAIGQAKRRRERV